MDQFGFRSGTFTGAKMGRDEFDRYSVTLSQFESGKAYGHGSALRKKERI